jgi:hypothetical protein
MSTKRKILKRRVFDPDDQKYKFYFDDNSMTWSLNDAMPKESDYYSTEIVTMNKPTELLTKETESKVAQYTLNSENIRAIDIDKFEKHHLLMPYYLPFLLEKKLVLLSDQFWTPRIRNVPIFNIAIYVCENELDYDVFSKLLRLSAVRSVDGITQALMEGQYVIYVNPRSEKFNGNTLFTIMPAYRPKVFPFLTSTYFSIKIMPDCETDSNSIGVGMSGMSLKRARILDAKWLDAIPPNIIWEVNYELSEEDAFKYIIVMAIRSDVNISMKLYVYIRKMLSYYREYCPQLAVVNEECYCSHESGVTTRMGVSLYDMPTMVAVCDRSS